jgi:hypothetical protein
MGLMRKKIALLVAVQQQKRVIFTIFHLLVLILFLKKLGIFS